MSEEKKDLFLSYNKSDDKWVRDLASRIEQETHDGTIKGSKLTVFYAPWDIENGGNFINEINRGLSTGHYFAAIMTPEYFESGWTNFEWTHVVAQDPMNLQGRIIPIFLRDVSLDNKTLISIPAPFAALNRIDFRKGNDFEEKFSDLIRQLQGHPKPRGSSGPATILQPNPTLIPASRNISSNINEVLVGNLFPIECECDTIWEGETTARDAKDVYTICSKTNEAFITSDKKIYSFSNLSDPVCSLYPVLSNPKNVNPTPLNAWFKDEDVRRKLVRLINQCVKQHCWERKIRKDEKGRFYFNPYYEYEESKRDAKTRVYRFKDGDRGREVAAKKTNPIDGKLFWVHYAAYIETVLFDDKIFLRIDPTFIFTTNGEHLLDGKISSKLSIRWSGKQQNPDVLRNVLFWGKVLADGKQEIRIPAGGYYLRTKVLPGLVETNSGIGGDYIRIMDLIKESTSELDQIAEEAILVQMNDLVSSNNNETE